jgi:hypothetical protein
MANTDSMGILADIIFLAYRWWMLVFMPLRVAGYFRQKPFSPRGHPVLATARGGLFSPETVPTGFRHLPAGRRYALHP